MYINKYLAYIVILCVFVFATINICARQFKFANGMMKVDDTARTLVLYGDTEATGELNVYNTAEFNSYTNIKSDAKYNQKV